MENTKPKEKRFTIHLPYVDGETQNQQNRITWFVNGELITASSTRFRAEGSMNKLPWMLYQNIVTLKNSIEFVMETLEESGNGMDEFRESVDELSTRIDLQDVLLSNGLVDIENIQLGMSQTSSEISKLDQEIVGINVVLIDQATVMGELSQASEMHESTISDHETRIVENKVDLESCEQEITKLKDDVKAIPILEERINTIEQSITSLTQNFDQLMLSSTTLRSDVDKNISEISDMKINIDANTKLITKTSEEIVNINESIALSETKITKNETEIGLVVQSVDVLRDDVTKLDVRIKNNEEGIVLIKSNVETIKVDIEKNKTDIVNINTSIDSIKADHTQLVTDYQTNKTSTDKTLLELQSQIDTINETINKPNGGE